MVSAETSARPTETYWHDGWDSDAPIPIAESRPAGHGRSPTKQSTSALQHIYARPLQGALDMTPRCHPTSELPRRMESGCVRTVPSSWTMTSIGTALASLNNGNPCRRIPRYSKWKPNPLQVPNLPTLSFCGSLRSALIDLLSKTPFSKKAPSKTSIEQLKIRLLP